jgi:hypothetical protein
MKHCHPALMSSVLVIALAAAGCTEQAHPTGPAPTELGVPAATMEPLAPLPSALIALEDVLGRVLIGMAPDPAADELRSALAMLASVLQANDGCRLPPSRHAAEAALQRMRARAPAGLGAELAVVELALGAVEPGEASGCER